jgi:hypothetical protein
MISREATVLICKHKISFSYYHERHENTRKSRCSKKYIAISKAYGTIHASKLHQSNNTLLENLNKNDNLVVEFIFWNKIAPMGLHPGLYSVAPLEL